MKNLVAALTLRFSDRLSSPARSAASAIGGIERAQKMAAGASAQWDRGLQRLDTRLNRLASASLVTDGIGRAGQSMIRPLSEGVKTAADFAQGMTGIGITAQLTDGQLAPLRNTILKTAADLGALPATVQATFGAVLAEGVYKTEAELSRAGIAVARFQRLQAVMGEPISNTEAGSFSSAMGSSLKLRADQLDRANAMVNRSAQQGGVSGATLARFLPGQTGSLVGLGFANERGLADLLTANQLAKRLAGSSDEAANNITNLMGKLASPEVLKNFSEAGIDLEAKIKAGVKRGISPLETVAQLTRDATSADQFRIGELVGDQQAKAGLMALVQNLDDFKTMSRELQGADVMKGYLADLDRAAQGPAASFARYTSGVARAGIATGTILAPAVSVAANALGRVANWMARASESGNFLAKAAVWAVAGIAGAAVAAGFLGHAVVGVLGPLYIAKTLLGADGLGGAAAKKMFASVIGGFSRMRLAAIGFNLSMLANPVVLAIAAVVAVVAVAAIVIRKYWQPISAFFTGIGQAFGEAFGPMAPILAPVAAVFRAIGGGVAWVFGWFGRLLTPVKSTTGELASATSAGRTFGRALVMAFRLSPIGLFVSGVTLGIRLVRGALNWRPMETLRGAWAPVSGFFGGLAGQFGGYGRAIMQGLIGGVRSMLGAVRNAVVGTASAAVTGFKAVLGIRSPSRVFDGLGAFTMAGLTQGLRRGGGAAVNVVSSVGGAMASALPGFGDDRPRPPAGGGASAYRASVQIGSLTIQVTVQGGGDPSALGKRIGTAAGDAFRARLFDGAGA